jgi:hypothetical protein
LGWGRNDGVKHLVAQFISVIQHFSLKYLLRKTCLNVFDRGMGAAIGNGSCCGDDLADDSQMNDFEYEV